MKRFSTAALTLAALSPATALSSPPSLAWATSTESPRALAASELSDRERALAVRCGVGDAALADVARHVLADKLRGARTPDSDALAFALRVAGEPHVWPRAWVVSGRALERDALEKRLDAWTQTLHDVGVRRCGAALGTAQDGTEVAVVVSVDAMADLAALPVRARVGQWLTVDARVLAPSTGARVVVMGPYGAPRSMPTSFDAGHVRARFTPDAPGAFTVQVVADFPSGPRPVLEASVFADASPPSRPDSRAAAAPGEEAALASSDDAASLEAMLAAMRRTEQRATFARDARLDLLARDHAGRMAAARTVAHDTGDGDPTTRLQRAGLSARDAGENVAHAPTVALAHRALYASPSHRVNLLRADFDRVGIGVVRDADGSVWVTELFASALR